MLSITYKFADHNDWRLSFNVSYDSHKFNYLQNCVTMTGDGIACWFHYVQRPLLFNAINKTIQIFIRVFHLNGRIMIQSSQMEGYKGIQNIKKAIQYKYLNVNTNSLFINVDFTVLDHFFNIFL